MAAEQATSAAGSEAAGESIEYGAFYFRHECGVPYERNEHWLGFFDRIAERIVRDLRPTSVLDAGCAMGFLVEALRRRGVEAWGIDLSEYAISQVDESVREFCRVASLSEPLERRYDLVTCIEVIEHLPPAETDAALANLCGASDRLLLSTSPEDFREATHLNVQAPEVWSAALAAEGLLRDLDHDFSFITPWAALYARVEEPLPDTVRRYDRAWWRLRHEVSEVRGALLESQGRLAELEAAGAEQPALREELARSEEEVLRLRDLLLERDAELGTARGHVLALEHQTQRLAGLLGRAQARVPWLMGIARAIWRGLRALRRG